MVQHDVLPDWQDGPGRPGWKPVVRHAPDAHGYHVPDSDQLRGMRGSPVGRHAVIPAARRDGRSHGFDPNVAGPVHVDPMAPDGGVIFDPATVRQRDLTAAVETSVYPHQVFYKLGVSAAQLGYGRGGWNDVPELSARTNPARPNDYVVPKAASDGRQLVDVMPDMPIVPPVTYRAYETPMNHQVPPLPALPPLGGPSQVPGPAPQPQPQMQPFPTAMHPIGPVPQMQAMPAGVSYYPPVPPMDPAMLQMMQQLANGMATMQAQMRQLEARPAPVPIVPPTTGLSSNPLPVGRPLATVPAELRSRRPRPDEDDEDDEQNRARPIRAPRKAAEDEEDEKPAADRSLVTRAAARKPQTVAEYEASDRRADAVITGFETLSLSFVRGPVADPPTHQVYLHLPTGKQSTKFHDVVQGNGCILLVYDTRFEYGCQFLPEDYDQTPILFEVPKLKIKRWVACMGMTASFGCFDLVILVEVKDPPAAPGDEE